jgi:hypothetical protein
MAINKKIRREEIEDCGGGMTNRLQIIIWAQTKNLPNLQQGGLPEERNSFTSCGISSYMILLFSRNG